MVEPRYASEFHSVVLYSPMEAFGREDGAVWAIATTPAQSAPPTRSVALFCLMPPQATNRHSNYPHRLAVRANQLLCHGLEGNSYSVYLPDRSPVRLRGFAYGRIQLSVALRRLLR